MDQAYRIYSAPEDEIPDEDRARLDGYLRALGERDASSWDSDTLQRLEAALAERARSGRYDTPAPDAKRAQRSEGWAGQAKEKARRSGP